MQVSSVNLLFPFLHCMLCTPCPSPLFVILSGIGIVEDCITFSIRFPWLIIVMLHMTFPTSMACQDSLVYVALLILLAAHFFCQHSLTYNRSSGHCCHCSSGNMSCRRTIFGTCRSDNCGCCSLSWPLEKLWCHCIQHVTQSSYRDVLHILLYMAQPLTEHSPTTFH